MSWFTGWKGNVMSKFETVPTPKNDPELLRPVRVTVLKAFCVRGQPVELGSIVELPRFVAADMIALKKAQMLDYCD